MTDDAMRPDPISVGAGYEVLGSRYEEGQDLHALRPRTEYLPPSTQYRPRLARDLRSEALAPRRRIAIGLTFATLASLPLLGCRSEDSRAEVAWSPGGTADVVRTSGLSAGPPAPDPTARNPYADDERSIAEGKALYEGFNCAGCHGSAGGGGIGPPFADRIWIYGDEPENIFQTIAQGRPNGMPAFGGKIPEEVIWKIVTYVRSLTPAKGNTSSNE